MFLAVFLMATISASPSPTSLQITHVVDVRRYRARRRRYAEFTS